METSVAAAPNSDELEVKTLLERLEQTYALRLDTQEVNDLADACARLPERAVCSRVESSYKMVILENARGNVQEARRWYDVLTGLCEGIREGAPERPLLDNRILCAGLRLSSGPNFHPIMNLSLLANGVARAEFQPARLSATGGFPSVLRGSKDLSSLGKYHKATVSIVKPMLPSVLEDSGEGVCEIAVAELLYEQNDLRGAALQTAQAAKAANPEIVFAALALQTRIDAAMDASQAPGETLSQLGALLEKKEASWLIPNYEALCVRFDILRGDIQKTRAWMDGCQLDDTKCVILRDVYRLITKAKAYIALGEAPAAASLLENLTSALRELHRPLDAIECLIGEAIAQEFQGNADAALDKLGQALTQAREYGYIRVFADYGKQLAPLLNRYAEQPPSHADLGYVEKISQATQSFAALWPDMCAGYHRAQPEKESDENTPAAVDLTEQELQILQLMAQGKSNKAMAAELSLDSTALKAQAASILTKLGASNRAQAIQSAKNLNLIRN